MYAPRHFEETRPELLLGLMQRHPLATLVHVGPHGEPVADLIPLLWQPLPDAAATSGEDAPPTGHGQFSEPSSGPSASLSAQAGGPALGPISGRLLGHVARANPLWQQAQGQNVLAVFQGPQAYVSPGWYPSKAEAGKAVPTWNYCMVQARGRLTVFDEPERLRPLLTRLTATHEAGQAQPWHLDDAPPDYLAAMLRGIVGFEIAVTALSGKWKVSQNRSEADRAGVAAGLRQRPAEADDAHAMAAWVAGGAGGR